MGERFFDRIRDFYDAERRGLLNYARALTRSEDAAEDAADGKLAVDIDLEVTVMRTRETIPGVRLPVGKPVLLTSKDSNRLTTDLGAWLVAAVRRIRNRGGHDRLVVVLLRLTLDS